MKLVQIDVYEQREIYASITSDSKNNRRNIVHITQCPPGQIAIMARHKLI